MRIALWTFVAATAAFFAYRNFFPDPYAFVAASRNYRSLGIPLLYFHFYDSILQEVAVFAVLGMAVFESLASAYSAPGKKGETAFAKTFFAAFFLGAAAHVAGSAGWIDYSWLSLSSLVGKGFAGYAYSVLSLFFIGLAIAPALDVNKWKGELRSSFPVLFAQLAVWPALTAAMLYFDARTSGSVTGGVPEIAEALMLLSLMPASITSAAVCARSGQTAPAKWVAASIGLFLLYCPFLLWDSFHSPALSVLDSGSTEVQSR